MGSPAQVMRVDVAFEARCSVALIVVGQCSKARMATQGPCAEENSLAESVATQGPCAGENSLAESRAAQWILEFAADLNKI